MPPSLEPARTPTSGRRMVAIAFACDPDRGSEPGAGWQWVKVLTHVAQRHNAILHVVTRQQHVARVEAELSHVRATGVTVHDVTARSLARLPPGLRFRLSYVLWSFKVGIYLRKLMRDDRSAEWILHHLTFASHRLPSPIHYVRLPAFLIWGPVGSSDSRGREGSSLHRVIDRALGYWSGLLARRFDLVLCQSDHAAKQMSTWSRTTVFPNCIVEPPAPTVAEAVDVPTVLVVGELSPRKRPLWALKIFARALRQRPGMRLRVIGNGPLISQLEALKSELALDENVEIMGAVSREQVLKDMASATVLLHTSYREGAPWVVAEAISAGMRVVTCAGNGADYLVRQSGAGVVCSGPDLDSALCVELLEQMDAGRLPSNAMWAPEEIKSRLGDIYAGQWG